MMVDAEYVVHRLEEAGKTFLAKPEAALRRGPNGSTKDILTTALEGDSWCQYRDNTSLPMTTTSSSSSIARMDEAMAWLTLIPRERHVLRRIVAARCLVSPVTGRNLWSWRRLGRVLGANHEAVKHWHDQGVDMIVTALRAHSPVLAVAA